MRRIRAIATITWLEMLRRKEAYVLLILLGGLLFVLLSMNVFGLGSVVGFVKDAGLLAAWLFGWVLAINCASRQLPQEEKRGTILPLLAKPICRMELIVGKWLGAWLAVAGAVTCFYLLTIAIVWSYGGTFELITMAQALVLHLVALGVIAAIAEALSTRLNIDAAATLTYIGTAIMFVIVPRIPVMAAHAEGWRKTGLFVLYGALPHLELFDMRRRVIHGYGPMPWCALGMILVYGGVLVSILLLLAWLGYQTKHFSRSNQD
jgi:Cu-processing system permease protein